MEAVFLKIVNMGITATWVVLAVIAMRFLLKKAPKWISVALWIIVGLRLVCPFSLESIFSLIPSSQTVPPEIMMDATPEVTTGINSLNNVLNPIISSAFAPNPGTSANPLQILVPVASIVWIVGMVVMLIYALISYWRLRRKVRESVYLKGPFQLCDHVDTPFILGIFYPQVYLPSNMNEEDMAYVMAHEKAHLRRYDHWWKPIGYLLLTVYWFQPVLWIAYILLCRDIEMACDEKVIQEMGPGSKKPYSEALLNCSVPRRIIAACPLAFGEVSIKTRIKSVLHYKQPAFWLIVLAVVLCLIFAVCFLTDPILDVGLTELKTDELDMPAIFSDVTEMTLSYKGKAVSCTGRLPMFLSLLEDMEVSKEPISQNRSEYRPKDFTVQINGRTELHFNDSFTEFWVDDHVKPSLSHSITSPDAGGIRQFFSIYYSLPMPDSESDGPPVLTEAEMDEKISAAILEHNKSADSDGLLRTVSYDILLHEGGNSLPVKGYPYYTDTWTLYVLYMQLDFAVEGNDVVEQQGHFGPAAITFTSTNGGEFVLTDYWEPRDGAYYADDIRARFPTVEADEVLLRHQNHVDLLEARCWETAREYLQAKNIFSANQSSEKPVLGSAMAWAGADEAAKLYEGAVNYKATHVSIERHLPIYKFDTKADLQQFMDTFEDNCDLDSGYDGTPSFRELTASFNDAFFAGNTVFLVYVATDSASHRYQINDYVVSSNPYTGTTFTLQVQEIPGTDPIDPTWGSWFVLTAVPDTMIKDCTEFDAILQ